MFETIQQITHIVRTSFGESDILLVERTGDLRNNYMELDKGTELDKLSGL